MDFYICLKFHNSLSFILYWRQCQTKKTDGREESKEDSCSVSCNTHIGSLIPFLVVSLGTDCLCLTVTVSHIWNTQHRVPSLFKVNYLLICWKQHLKNISSSARIRLFPLTLLGESWEHHRILQAAQKHERFVPFSFKKKLKKNLHSFLQLQGCLSAFVLLYLFPFNLRFPFHKALLSILKFCLFFPYCLPFYLLWSFFSEF